MKAILSQFANRLDNDEDEVPSTRALKKSKQAHMAKPRPSARSAATSTSNRSMFPACAGSDSSDDDCHASDNDSRNDDDDDDDRCNPDYDPLDILNQDEVVIRAAEGAQEEDLDEAAQSAEFEVAVTDKEQKVASTALSKVSVVIYVRVRVLTHHIS